MNFESFRQYCLGKEEVTEEFPFDNSTLVFKTNGKIFALTNVESFESINLKCPPEEAVQLREQYMAVQPGYHMNKKHWNTLLMDGTLPDKLVKSCIDLSYGLVFKKPSLKKRNHKEEMT